MKVRTCFLLFNILWLRYILHTWFVVVYTQSSYIRCSVMYYQLLYYTIVRLVSHAQYFHYCRLSVILSHSIEMITSKIVTSIRINTDSNLPSKIMLLLYRYKKVTRVCIYLFSMLHLAICTCCFVLIIGKFNMFT